GRSCRFRAPVTSCSAARHSLRSPPAWGSRSSPSACPRARSYREQVLGWSRCASSSAVCCLRWRCGSLRLSCRRFSSASDGRLSSSACRSRSACCAQPRCGDGALASSRCSPASALAPPLFWAKAGAVWPSPGSRRWPSSTSASRQRERPRCSTSMPTGACRARRWRSSPSPTRGCVPSSTACCCSRQTSRRQTRRTVRFSSASRSSARPGSFFSTRRAAKFRACASWAISLRNASSRRLPPHAIDHAVIAVRDLDAAAAKFTALGFTLTPRGHHSIGSQNHCIMLGSTYLELLVAPVAHPWLDYYRRFGEGLAAIALSTSDADATYELLKGKGAKPPMDLSRPADGGVARFRLVQIEGSPQVFFVQHL